MSAVVATQLVVGYGAGSRRREVARLSIDIAPGEIVAIVGPNGAGKTTLMRTLAGMLPPLGGTLLIAGVSPDRYRKSGCLGYLPERLELPDHWSVAGLIELAALSSSRVSTDDVAFALRTAGVDFPLEQPCRVLSQGMRRRAALALALLPPPALLLLDEPELGLDPAQRIRLRERLRALGDDGVTVLISSHDVTGLCTVADHTYLLRDGSLQSIEQRGLADPSAVLRMFEHGP